MRDWATTVVRCGSKPEPALFGLTSAFTSCGHCVANAYSRFVPIATKVQRRKKAFYARDLVRGKIIHDEEVASVLYFASASATPKRANISTAVPSALSFASDASSLFRMASSAFRAPRAVRTIHDGL